MKFVNRDAFNTLHQKCACRMIPAKCSKNTSRQCDFAIEICCNKQPPAQKHRRAIVQIWVSRSVLLKRVCLGWAELSERTLQAAPVEHSETRASIAKTQHHDIHCPSDRINAGWRASKIETYLSQASGHQPGQAAGQGSRAQSCRSPVGRSARHRDLPWSDPKLA